MCALLNGADPVPEERGAGLNKTKRATDRLWTLNRSSKHETTESISDRMPASGSIRGSFLTLGRPRHLIARHPSRTRPLRASRETVVVRCLDPMERLGCMSSAGQMTREWQLCHCVTSSSATPSRRAQPVHYKQSTIYVHILSGSGRPRDPSECSLAVDRAPRIQWSTRRLRKR